MLLLLLLLLGLMRRLIGHARLLRRVHAPTSIRLAWTLRRCLPHAQTDERALGARGLAAHLATVAALLHFLAAPRVLARSQHCLRRCNRLASCFGSAVGADATR